VMRLAAEKRPLKKIVLIWKHLIPLWSLYVLPSGSIL
jgi:hypothetical protein